MARVDSNDDSVRRFIVYHYRYDPARHERRRVVVAAFDNNEEFEACLEEAAAEIRGRKERGDLADSEEHVSGAFHEPGYDRKQQNARLIKRSIEHGVLPANVEQLELPSNFALLRAERAPWWRRTVSWLRRRG
jgi:hypothetical protein